MMDRKQGFWHQPVSQQHSKPSSKQEKQVFFGFQKIPEQEKVGRIKRHFDTVADRYDFMNTLLSFGIHYLWKRTAVGMMQLKRGDSVLDICGGTGDLSVLAARRVAPSGRNTIYDINRKMMGAGRAKRSHLKERDRIRYVQGDAEKISFPDQTFDAAMVGFGIRNLTHMDEGFREMYRVLKPGGKMMCLEFSKPSAPLFRRLYDLYSFYVMPLLGEVLVGSRQAYTLLPESIRMFPMPDELSSLLRDIGFRQVHHRKLTNGIAVVHIAVKP